MTHSIPVRVRVTAAALVVLAGSLAMVGTSRAAFVGSTANAGNTITAAATFAPTYRVTTYEVRTGAFTGTSYTLALDQALANDYFVVLRGGASNGSANRNPNQNYARVDGDPHGSFATVTAADRLQLRREAASSSWQGQVTVIESLGDATTSGFRLLDVVEVTFPALATTASGTASPGWTDIGQVGVYGGIRGGGVATTTGSRANHRTAWIRAFPSGASTIDLTREDNGGGSLGGTTTWTGYVVEWGSHWSIQRVTVGGVAGGQGADNTTEYLTAAINPVARAGTFVLAYGHTADDGLGDGWEGQIWTLGDGVNQNATESTVALGSEYGAASDGRTAEVYVHTHADLAVDHVFGTDGGTGIPTGSLTGTRPIDAALTTETYDNSSSSVRTTSGQRFAVASNTSNGTGTAYPRPMVWVRPTSSTTATWTRSRSGQPGALWLQSIDFGAILHAG